MADVSALAHLAAAAGAVGAGVVNALAGGGTLISYPVLTAVGVPFVNANATNTVALCPGYVGGTYALRAEIEAAKEPLRTRLIVSGTGGFLGALLLMFTSNSLFRAIVPYLILLSCLLLAVQDPLRRWVTGHRGEGRMTSVELTGVFLAGAYGGYFGAGLGIMLIAVLGLFSSVPFVQLNAVKQPLAAAINLSAAAFLVFSGKVEWTLAAVMAPAALVGGGLGGRLSTIIPGRTFRWVVVAIGVVVSIVYLVR
jgi:uncharacterized membrane protein YfcA